MAVGLLQFLVVFASAMSALSFQIIHNRVLLRDSNSISSAIRSSQISMVMNRKVIESDTSLGFPDKLFQPIKTVWDFSRPHTIIGSALSIVSLFLFAIPPTQWKSKQFVDGLLACLAPSMLANLYITGLNQVTDIEIDKVNKPYLPLASGRLSKSSGTAIVLASLLGSLLLIRSSAWPLQATVLGSIFLGTIYSLPPFRLKRFPLLAAFCILVVRGSLVNLGFLLQAKTVMGSSFKSVRQAVTYFPESWFVTAFFALYGLVIALLKDVPDVSGDLQNNIRTFSVKAGAKKMFR